MQRVFKKNAAYEGQSESQGNISLVYITPASQQSRFSLAFWQQRVSWTCTGWPKNRHTTP